MQSISACCEKHPYKEKTGDGDGAAALRYCDPADCTLPKRVNHDNRALI